MNATAYEGDMEILNRSDNAIQDLYTELLAADGKDRQRVARDIHDNLASYLVALKLDFERTISAHRRNGVAMKELVEFGTKIRHAIGESCRIMADIYPSVLEDFGIRAAVPALCEQFQEKHPQLSITSEVELDEDAVSESLKFMIFKIIREELKNVAGQRKTATVSVSLHGTGSAVEMRIEVYGASYEHETPDHENGLSHVRAHIELTGGVFSARSIPGRGIAIGAFWRGRTPNDGSNGN
ncbi:MAG: histidine kinase [Syntrophobacteraceae bacterium]